jgi:hypothetical protein
MVHILLAGLKSYVIDLKIFHSSTLTSNKSGMNRRVGLYNPTHYNRRYPRYMFTIFNS